MYWELQPQLYILQLKSFGLCMYLENSGKEISNIDIKTYITTCMT